MKETKDFWNTRAQEVIDELAVTDNDVYRRILETKTLVDLIPEEHSVLDVGCGAGWGTRQFSKKASITMGIDFSSKMIINAIEKRNYAKINAETQIGYDVDDIRTSDIYEETFEVVITQRCLINILDLESQYQAIRNIYKKIVPGGLYLMLEGSKNGRDGLNIARENAGLANMHDVPFNRDFEEDDLQNFLADLFNIEQKIYFGMYDYISRVIYPLAISCPTIVQPAEPQYLSSINEYASKLPVDDKFKNISRTFLYVLRKK